MNIFDISMPITPEMPVYKGLASQKPVFSVEKDFSNDSIYETRLTLNLHTGTHLDAPMHMLQDGESIDKLNLNRVITPCKVLNFTGVSDKISQCHLAEKPIKEGDFLLFKTRNSNHDLLEKDYIYLDQSGAQYLKEKQINGVGIDSLGIERSQPAHPTHKLLLDSKIIILEGLRLHEVDEGNYLLYALPIHLIGVEAAPVRAILVDLN